MAADTDTFPRHARSWHADVDTLVPDHHRRPASWRTSARNLIGMAGPRRGAHDGDRLWCPAFWRTALLMAILIASVVLLIFGTFGAHASTQSRGVAALQWAESKAGDWYQYGAAGPSTFDCSGLVYRAYLAQGINIGRDTYDMLASSHLVRVSASQAQRGYLAFYGSGHVEFVTKRGTFGALETGTRIGWHRPSASFHPTMYFRVR
jgi:NlpC/P60 family